MLVSRILGTLFGSQAGQPVAEPPTSRNNFMVKFAKIQPESPERKAFLAENRHMVLNGGANTFGWSAPKNATIATPEDFSEVKCTVFIRHDGSVGAAGGLFNRVRLETRLFEVMTKAEQEAHIFNLYKNEIEGRSVDEIVDDIEFDEDTQKWKIIVDEHGNPDVNGAIRQNALGRETGEEHRDLGKSDLAEFLDPAKTVWDRPSVDDAFILRWNPHKDGPAEDTDVVASSQSIFAVDASCGANQLTTEEMAVIEEGAKTARASGEMGGMIVEDLFSSLTRLHDGAPGVEKTDENIYRYPHEYFRKWILAAQVIDGATTERREKGLTALAIAVQQDISLNYPGRKLSFDAIAEKTGKSFDALALELSVSGAALARIQGNIEKIALHAAHSQGKIKPACTMP